MGFSNAIVREADDAIVTTIFTGHITPEDFEGWNREIEDIEAQVFSTPAGRVYTIMDVSGSVTTDFGTILREMTIVPDELKAVEPYIGRFKLMFVGDAAMAKLTVELARRKSFFGGVDIPMFRTMDDAHAFIRIDRQQVRINSGE